ncbi:MAG: hypothetical protein U1C53_00785 [Candidatus Veblenbacteria bacterium]|nr:hypothetical protein [Candidatus Veblenbacteria bacterium]MDZ4229654.1 hypothetical protein [Candidatus Veblenbacteria bacterium]
MLLDIVVLPPAKERRRLGALAQRLSQDYPARYIVDNKKLIPHVSLYHFRTSQKRLKDVEQVMRMIVTKTGQFRIAGVALTKGQYSIGLKLQNPPALKRLNKAVLLHCASLRTGSMPNIFSEKMTKQVKQALKDYGTVGTVINYEPHITLLANFKSSRVKQKRGAIGNFRVGFSVNELAITEVNCWYQVTRVIKRFRV